MTPVISPWVFYAISVADGLRIAGWVMVTLIAIGLFCIGIYFAVESEWMKDDAKQKIAALVKKSITSTLVILMSLALIPSSKTITKMIVAQNVTYERVEVVTDTVETVYNDIMGLFEDSNDG